MPRVSLESVIDKDLVNRLRGLASGAGGAGQNVLKALNGSGSAVSIADGLRQGARTLTTSVKNLNSTIALVNISRSVLEDLGGLTDKMIRLAERASQAGTGSSTRASLDRDFKKLANSFKQTLDKAKIGDRELLTLEGLSEIFQAVGLEKGASDSIAKVFSEFIVTKKDDSLASEYSIGRRPVNVPRTAFSGPASTIQYNLQKLSDSDISGMAQIATGTNIFVDEDDILNQNPGYNALFSVGESGTLSSMRSGMLDRDFDTLAINEHSGYSLIGTTQDLGNNAANDYVTYLVNDVGEIVHRFENFATNGAATFEDAFSFQISDDNSTISYIQREADASQREYRVMKQVASSFSTTGGTSATSQIDSISYNHSLGDPISSFDTLKMSDDGSTFAYNKFNGSFGEYYTVFDAWSEALAVPMDSFEFIDNNKLVFINSLDGQVHSHTLNDGSSTALTSGLSDVTHLRALQASAGNSGYFVLDSDLGSGARRAALYSALDLSPTFSFDTQASDSISSLSIAYNVAGQPEMGVLGAVRSLANDSDVELYRFTANSRATGQRFERMSKEFSSLFASEANIRSRADAFRMHIDLKALKEQITKNLSALDAAVETLGKNLELARATGLAFLDASSSLANASDASAVASALRSAIRSNASQALSQAENLEPIIVAALALDIKA